MTPKNQTPLIGAYLLLFKENKILLSQRGRGRYINHYSLVAGHTEESESVIEAIIREAKEEANIELDAKDLTVSAVIHRPQAPYKEGTADIIDFFIKAEKYTGEIKNNEPHKCFELTFADLNTLPENTLKHVIQALKMHQENEYFSVFKGSIK